MLTETEILEIRDALVPAQGEPFDHVAFAHKLLERAVPKEPRLGLLMSMAVRFDHGLAAPGHYDGIRRMSNGDPHLPSHAQRLASTLRVMRQLYEEVSGQGFYSLATDDRYVQWAQNGLKPDTASALDAPAQTTTVAATQAGADDLIGG